MGGAPPRGDVEVAVGPGIRAGGAAAVGEGDPRTVLAEHAHDLGLVDHRRRVRAHAVVVAHMPLTSSDPPHGMMGEARVPRVAGR